MTIDEAIKLQEELLTLLPEVGFNKYIASSKLGIEALKWRQLMEDSYGSWCGPPLPGETEE